ncbi:hypothetical protein ABN034_14925 [Actinopolymorpha sp. B11F2]
MATLDRRAHAYLAAAELIVHYYRIGRTLAFELPVAARPGIFRPRVLGVHPYPWLIWLGWELEERWRVLASAARRADTTMPAYDEALATEFAGLAGWDSRDAVYGGAGLVTPALAAGVADVVGHARRHDRQRLKPHAPPPSGSSTAVSGRGSKPLGRTSPDPARRTCTTSAERQSSERGCQVYTG